MADLWSGTVSVTLEMRVLHGHTVVAALVRNTIKSTHLGRNMHVSGSRSVCAVLILRGGQLVAFTPTGETMASTEVEALCPGAEAKLMAAVAR